MYNRYIPGANGVYERHSVQEAIPEAAVSKERPSEICKETCGKPEKTHTPIPRTAGPQSLDLGDLLLLCIVLLLLIDCDQDETLSILITAAAFLFLQ